MATNNKSNKVTNEENSKTEVNQEVSQEIVLLKEQMNKKESENEELRSMLKELSEMIKNTTINTANLTALGGAQQSQENFDDELVYINNNSIGSQILTADKYGHNSQKILPSEKNRPIEKEFIRQAIQNNKVRRLFEYGIIEFCSEKFYKIYGIEQKFDMSEENVLKMFSKDNISRTSSQLTELFKRPDSSALEHELVYKALDLYDNGKFPDSDIATIVLTLNKIFCSKVSCNFEDLVGNLPIKRGEFA